MSSRANRRPALVLPALKFLKFLLLSGIASGLGAGPTLAQPVAAARQAVEVTVGTGWSGLWDDETNLGKGVALSGGLATTLASHLRLSADVDWTAHRRRAGYLSTDGDAVAVLAHGAWLFGAADERVRPSAGGGLGVLRSTGRLDLAGDSTDWSITKPVWELNGGLRIALNRRLALRSEYRFRNTVGGRSGRTGLEPPLLGMQAMVSVDVGLR